MNAQPAFRPNMPRVALLGAAVFFLPLVLGILFVLAYQRLAAPPRTAPDADHVAAITNRLNDLNVTDLDELFLLRREARQAGIDTDEINLRIWAAQTARPAVLFRVAPPALSGQWDWHLSQDGRYAVAVSADVDAADRRCVGLFDLIANEWLWQNALPWPDTHEAPYVFDRRLILRYIKNASRFALEIAPEGRIVSIDRLQGSAFALHVPPPAHSACPGKPVAVKGAVFFATDPDRQHLVGYALERVPGLRDAGLGDDNTLFSGNGRLKFAIKDGVVTVSDSLTQTVLQRLNAWKPATNITVTGALTTHDGSSLSVFLKADFGGTPAVTREWSVAIATYSGTVLPSFNPDALLAKPRRVVQKQAVSRDGRWQLSLSAANELQVCALPGPREIARAAIGEALGLRRPLDHIAFLETGRHVVLRQGERFWLLDFAAARGYADLVSRMEASAAGVAALAQAPAETNLPPAVLAMTMGEDAIEDFEPWPPLPPAAPYALRAERCAAHQAWPYAAALLDRCYEYSQSDGRAPRVNPLLYTRAKFLSGQPAQARLICRRALVDLLSDNSDYNRMIRYQLQGLFFSER